MKQNDRAIRWLHFCADKNRCYAAAAPMPCSIAFVIARGFIVGDDQQPGIFKYFAGEERAENILQPVVRLLQRVCVAAARGSLIAPAATFDAVAVVVEIGNEE